MEMSKNPKRTKALHLSAEICAISMLPEATALNINSHEESKKGKKEIYLSYIY